MLAHLCIGDATPREALNYVKPILQAARDAEAAAPPVPANSQDHGVVGGLQRGLGVAVEDAGRLESQHASVSSRESSAREVFGGAVVAPVGGAPGDEDASAFGRVDVGRLAAFGRMRAREIDPNLLALLQPPPPANTTPAGGRDDHFEEDFPMLGGEQADEKTSHPRDDANILAGTMMNKSNNFFGGQRSVLAPREDEVRSGAASSSAAVVPPATNKKRERLLPADGEDEVMEDLRGPSEIDDHDRDKSRGSSWGRPLGLGVDGVGGRDHPHKNDLDILDGAAEVNGTSLGKSWERWSVASSYGGSSGGNQSARDRELEEGTPPEEDEVRSWGENDHSDEGQGSSWDRPLGWGVDGVGGRDHPHKKDDFDMLDVDGADDDEEIPLDKSLERWSVASSYGGTTGGNRSARDRELEGGTPPEEDDDEARSSGGDDLRSEIEDKSRGSSSDLGTGLLGQKSGIVSQKGKFHPSGDTLLGSSFGVVPRQEGADDKNPQLAMLVGDGGKNHQAPQAQAPPFGRPLSDHDTHRAPLRRWYRPSESSSAVSGDKRSRCRMPPLLPGVQGLGLVHTTPGEDDHDQDEQRDVGQIVKDEQMQHRNPEGGSLAAKAAYIPDDLDTDIDELCARMGGSPLITASRIVSLSRMSWKQALVFCDRLQKLLDRVVDEKKSARGPASARKTRKRITLLTFGWQGGVVLGETVPPERSEIPEAERGGGEEHEREVGEHELGGDGGVGDPVMLHDKAGNLLGPGRVLDFPSLCSDTTCRDCDRRRGRSPSSHYASAPVRSLKRVERVENHVGLIVSW